jgi:bifunctional UDP-N-acetylglucosamine pyrophosphorylase/glucosamine-1-phosphate N-acetyltransferase
VRRVLIVPAAGRGSRLGSELPKLLVPVNGRAMIDYIFDRYHDLISEFLLVVSPTAAGQVTQHVARRSERIELLIQETPTGMLDAIMIPRPRVEVSESEEIWVTWCDQVAVEGATVARLAQAMGDPARPDLVFPTVKSEQPYIHFARDGNGAVTAVLHRREGDAMPTVGEGDIGLFALSARAYLQELPVYAAHAPPGKLTGERNFLPFIPWLARRKRVEIIPATAAIEAVGINTPEDLARIAQHLAAG